MPTQKLSLINIDDPESIVANYPYVVLVLETTRALERLYGRQVAQRFFTKHITFDTIKITVK